MAIIQSTTAEAPITEEQLLAPLDLSPTDRLHVYLDEKCSERFKLIVADSRGSEHFASHDARVKFMDRLPEHEESKAGLGTVHYTPCTDVSVTVIRRLWPADQIVLDEESGASTTFMYLCMTIDQQAHTMMRTARYHEWAGKRNAAKARGEPVPEVDFVEDFEMGNERKPMVHQRVGMWNSYNTDGYLLFMEQGTGKTGCVIGRVDAESVRPEIGRRMYRVLVVAPKNVRQNWVNEFTTFSVVPGRAAVLRGDPSTRRTELIQALVPKSPDQRYTVLVISYEALGLDWDIVGKIPWDLAVLDEIHFIKSPKAKRSKNAMKLRDQSAARIGLTGTPVCNTPADLYMQLEFARKGGSGFSKFTSFCDFYGVIKVADPRRAVKRFADVENMPFMQERLARVAYVVRKAEALPDLPEKMYDISEVQMTKEQQTIYDTVREQLYYEIMDEAGSGRTMMAQNVLTKLLRLGQITSGFLTMDPIIDLDTGEKIAPKVIEAIEPNPKIERLVRLLKGLEDEADEDELEAKPGVQNPLEKTIICACWVWDILKIEERLNAEGINCVTFYGSTNDKMRLEAERRFNEDPECSVFIMNPGCGGVGLNLVGYDWWSNPNPKQETNCTTVVYYSQDWSNPKRSQSEDRAHRTGTRVPVRYVDLTVPGSIDEEIRARVLDKKHTATQIQDMRDILARILNPKGKTRVLPEDFR